MVSLLSLTACSSQDFVSENKVEKKMHITKLKIDLLITFFMQTTVPGTGNKIASKKRPSPYPHGVNKIAEEMDQIR